MKPARVFVVFVRRILDDRIAEECPTLVSPVVSESEKISPDFTWLRVLVLLSALAAAMLGMPPMSASSITEKIDIAKLLDLRYSPRPNAIAIAILDYISN